MHNNFELYNVHAESFHEIEEWSILNTKVEYVEYKKGTAYICYILDYYMVLYIDIMLLLDIMLSY